MTRVPVRLPTLGTLLALVPLLGACSSAAGQPGGSLTVFAAASLSDTFPVLARQFEAAHPGVRVTVSFGASSALAQQILDGAPADVFASASDRNMSQVVAAGDAASARDFAANRAEIAVSPDSAGRVKELADLAAPGVKVALCQPEVPCGALAQTVLDNAHLAVSPVTRGLDVKAVLSTVGSGEVDAGIVYVTDVKAAGGTVVGVAIPASLNARTTYPLATVPAGRHAELAQAFEDYVLSPPGQRVLAEAGFAAP